MPRHRFSTISMDIDGEILGENEFGEFTNIPYICPECGCIQSRDLLDTYEHICNRCNFVMHIENNETSEKPKSINGEK